MLRTRFAIVAFIVAAGLAAPAVLAGTPPAVYSVQEGVDPAAGTPTLSLVGKKLNRYVSFALLEGEELIGVPVAVSKKSALLVLRLPAAIPAGSYTLALEDRSGKVENLLVDISGGKPLPASIEHSALSPSLVADLHDAGNLQGTVGDGLFSAYGDLQVEGKVGAEAGQLSEGDHGHEGVYAADGHDHDAAYASLVHGHGTSWAPLVGAKVYLESNLTHLVNEVDHFLAFDTEEFDTDGIHSTTTNADRLTCNSPGYYAVSLRILLQGETADLHGIVSILTNGVPVARVEGRIFYSSTLLETLNVSEVLYLEEGDYIQVVARNPNALEYYFEVVGGQATTTLSMVRIGSTPAAE